jgi:hypothetical protein
MKISKYLIAVSMAAAACGASAQNIVVNGSFEENAQANGTWSIYNNLVGWTGQSNIELRNNVAGTAQQGVNYVELDTTRNMSMTQTIQGYGDYLLSFWYSARPGVAAGSNGLSYSLGSLTGSVLNNVAGGNANSWQHFQGVVTLNGKTSLTFGAIGVTDSYGGSLDNISVTAVPEAETYAMMLAGLGMIGTIVRRRKSKAA